MGIFDGYLILTDIDGTLTWGGKVSQKNADAIRYFQREGGLFTVASGRFPWFIEQFRDAFVPNTYIVGANGTMLYDAGTKTVVDARPLPGDVIPILEESVALCPETSMLVISSPKEDRHVGREDFGRLRECLADHERPWFKVIFVQDAKLTPRVCKVLRARWESEYNLDLSWGEGLELHRKDSGKGQMLPKILSLLEAQGKFIRVTVGVGDYENDISLLRAATYGYAVDNAIPAVKQAANRFTARNDRDAIAAIIDDLSREVQG